MVGAAFGLLWPGILVVAAMAAWQLQADRRQPSDLQLAGLFVLASVGSPLSYLAGARFGAVEWLAPAWQVVLLLGPVWALAVTGLFLAARRLGRQHNLGRAALASRGG